MHVGDVVRVRFAPSPTGHLHIGGARTAIYNWAFARHHGGVFVLRIDDTDRERSTDENTRSILRAMRWLGLDWDEGPDVGGGFGPYFQTQRSDTYSQALEVLKANGHAYPCFCTPEQLEAQREAARLRGGFSGYDRTCRAIPQPEASARVAAGEPHVWRVKVPDGRGDIIVDDAIRGTVTFPIDAMDDFILVRTDTTPTYMFATVVDDWRMGITHIIRGDDHLSNTPRQVIVYEALEAPVPRFAHMGLIFGSDGKRLSKRHGATSVEAYREAGYLPEVILNYLAILGWSIDDRTTIFDRDRLVRDFDLSRVSSNPAVWDPEKLDWMNGLYLREMPVGRFVDLMSTTLVDAEVMTPEQAEERRGWLEQLAPLVRERIRTLADLVPTVRFFFGDAVEVSPEAADKALATEGAGRALEAASSVLQSLEPFDAERIEAALRMIPETTGIKPKVAFQAVRVAVTGSTVSPPLFESLALLGRARTLARLTQARPLCVD